ncbi:MAG: hypothetical protein A2X94_09465 [Bdellovibrionales bacterium GWB1_55_8]|nr:MAG: hypothetical protein A2X94_09465 [Bdellovibrionales bacterium GWB1_55_8]
MSNPGASQVLRGLIGARLSEWSTGSQERVVRFYDLLVEENSVQNLTRLTSPEDFLNGHLEDVLALLRSELLGPSAMDLGSGGGVPGLLAACLEERPWILVDSEKRKAEFLEKARSQLDLPHVRVFHGRGEDVLLRTSADSIVARAVGPAERIFAWIGKCSTWNNLVLLKGPGWADEWGAFSRGRYRDKLKIGGEFEYAVGPELKQRRIVRLNRVPRGTIA